jgi:hypothetical protein
MVKAQIEHQTWGEWPSVKLSTEAVELEVVSEVGARVVSLRDKRRDREWLVQGEPPTELEQMAWAAEGVAFGGRESFGWDECLPTTAPSADPLVPGTDLRDHGDQWGRGAYLNLDHSSGAVEHSWTAPRWGYRLHRRLSFADPVRAEIKLRLDAIDAIGAGGGLILGCRRGSDAQDSPSLSHAPIQLMFYPAPVRCEISASRSRDSMCSGRTASRSLKRVAAASVRSLPSSASPSR